MRYHIATNRSRGIDFKSLVTSCAIYFALPVAILDLSPLVVGPLEANVTGTLNEFGRSWQGCFRTSNVVFEVMVN